MRTVSFDFYLNVYYFRVVQTTFFDFQLNVCYFLHVMKKWEGDFIPSFDKEETEKRNFCQEICLKWMFSLSRRCKNTRSDKCISNSNGFNFIITDCEVYHGQRRRRKCIRFVTKFDCVNFFMFGKFVSFVIRKISW